MPEVWMCDGPLKKQWPDASQLLHVLAATSASSPTHLQLRKETPEGYMLSLQTPLADSMPDLAALQRLYCPG